MTDESFFARVERALASDGAVEEVLRLTIAELGMESGTVHLRGDDDLLHLRAAQGIPEPVLPMIQRIPVGKGMAGLAVERAEPVTACNIQTDDSGDVRPGAKATEMQGVIVVPVLSADRAIGAFGVAMRAEREFSAEERELLMRVGRAVAGHAG